MCAPTDEVFCLTGALDFCRGAVIKSSCIAALPLNAGRGGSGRDAALEVVLSDFVSSLDRR